MLLIVILPFMSQSKIYWVIRTKSVVFFIYDIEFMNNFSLFLSPAYCPPSPFPPPPPPRPATDTQKHTYTWSPWELWFCLIWIFLRQEGSLRLIKQENFLKGISLSQMASKILHNLSFYIFQTWFLKLGLNQPATLS